MQFQQVFRRKIEATHRGELFVSEPLHISINHYGPHGHSYSHVKRIPINLPHLEDFPHGARAGADSDAGWSAAA